MESNLFKKLMKDTGLTPTEASRALNVCRQSVYNWIWGKSALFGGELQGLRDVNSALFISALAARVAALRRACEHKDLPLRPGVDYHSSLERREVLDEIIRRHL